MPEPVAETLNVQVAKALGWMDIVEENGVFRGRNRQYPAASDGDGRWRLQTYDISWCAIGPLVNQYRLSVEFHGGSWYAHRHSGHDVVREVGTTPTEALAKLIVTLHKKGKLEGAA